MSGEAGANGNPYLGDMQPTRAILAFTVAAAVAVLSWELGNIERWRYVSTERSWVTALTVLLAVLAYRLLPFVWPVLPTPVDGAQWRNDPAFLKRIGVVVPAHRSAAEIVGVLERLLRYFEPEHIMVVDNSNLPTPPDHTREVVASVDQRIGYRYIPQGHKTRALLEGTLALSDSIDFVLHLDDDTQLSESMVFDAAHFDNVDTVAVAFAIRMLPASAEALGGGGSLVSALVDWEFILFSIRRTFCAARVSAFFCHGIVGLWRRGAWTARLLGHPAMPFGEDNWIGCDTMSRSECIGAELRCHVTTYAPDRLFPPLAGCLARGRSDALRSQGYGASSVWKQRAERWYTNAPRRVSARLYQLCFYRGRTLAASLWMRLFLIEHLAMIAVALAFPSTCVHLALRRASTPLLLGAGVGMVVLHRLVFSLIAAALVASRSPQLAPRASAVLLYPLYEAFLDVAVVWGHWRSLLWYQPFWPLQRLQPARWAAAAEASDGGRADVLEAACSLLDRASTGSTAACGDSQSQPGSSDNECHEQSLEAAAAGKAPSGAPLAVNDDARGVSRARTWFLAASGLQHATAML